MTSSLPSTFWLSAGAGAALLLSWLLTALVRRYALRADLLDHPNERSSHSVPTPRGGGVAIVAVFLLATAVLATWGIVSARLAVAILGAGALVACLGFVDDRRPLPARVRFGGHLLAAAWVAWWLGALPPLPILGQQWPMGLLGPVLAVIFTAASINLFNFMDGIDGIASIEALTVCLAGALLWSMAGVSHHWLMPWLLAACVAGFLIWNFPPARIFMGDAGSGFLGLLIAVLTLWSATEKPVLFWAWMILYGCFLVDSAVTFVRRVRRGEKFYVAHRSHAYQFASRLFSSHRAVSLAVGAINVFWLLPWALCVAWLWIDGLLALCIAYAPLVWLAFRFKAGDRAAQAGAESHPTLRAVPSDG